VKVERDRDDNRPLELCFVWEDGMNRYLAEFVGTFILIFCGVGAAVLDGKDLGPVGISLAFGLTLTAMAYAIGPISGCHINPAVTIGLAVAGRTRWSDVPGYVVAQIVGGIAGAAALLPIVGSGGIGGAANTVLGSYTLSAGFLTEALLTMVLVLTVIGATSKNAPNGFAGIPIGIALAVTNFVAIPVTNASINPARSIGPAIFAGPGDAWGQLWLFVVAPIVGGIVAAIVYGLIKNKD
jgi:aquaporin Z